MARKKEDPPEGAPEWMLTYGDMITLVLCFFVLLFSMSEIRKDRLTKTMRSFQKLFSVLPKYKASVQVFVQPRTLTQTEANVLRKGPPGVSLNVETIDQGKKMKIAIAGKQLFRENEAILLPVGRTYLKTFIAPEMKGYENKIEVRGHTASAPKGSGGGFRDEWELSYARAYAVMRFLVDSCGIEEERFRVVAAGSTEPVNSNDISMGQESNRRVEVVMTEEFMVDRRTRLPP